MANSKISGLTPATTPLVGTEELALLQTSDKRITVANFAAGAVKSIATTGVIQITGPTTGQTRVMTTPDANFTVARTDAGQTFFGESNFNSTFKVCVSDGSFYAGTTSGDSGVRYRFAYPADTTNGTQFFDTASATNAIFLLFSATIGGNIGSITRDGTTNAVKYNTSSDERLKEHIIDAPSASTIIDSIKIRSFDWKSGGHQTHGVIAQELNTIVSSAVTQPMPYNDVWGVDLSKLVPFMVKEIQDLRARVAVLEINKL